MKATANQQVRASYPSAQARSPAGNERTTAPAARNASVVPRSCPPRRGVRATSRIT